MERGKLVKKFEYKSGTSAAGNNWQAQDILCEIRYGREQEYSRYILLKAFGDMVAEIDGAREGDEVSFEYRVSAREYKERWYNDVTLTAFKIESAERKSEPIITPKQVENNNSDLPF